MRKAILPVSIVIVGFALIFPISSFLEARRPSLPENYEDQDLSLQGERLKGFSLGAEGLIADWYWMRSLQYIGNKLIKTKVNSVNLENLRPLNPRLLYPLLDNATTLDPKFMAAYSYGAVVLPAIDEQKAIALLEKGIADNPKQWRLYQHLGYIYWILKDFEKASITYGQGADIPGAPSFMRSMAAKLKNDGGDRSTAREIYLQMFNEAEDSQTKEQARLRLMQLESQDELEVINMSLAQLKQRNGSCVKDLREILQLLKQEKLPNGREFHIDKDSNIVDPTNVAYVLDKQTCKARLDKTKTIIPPQ